MPVRWGCDIARTATGPRSRGAVQGRHAAVLAAGLCLQALASWVSAQPQPQDAGSPAVARELTRTIVQAVDRMRAQEAGAPPLAEDARLAAAAQDLASHMAATGSYGHDADGRQPADRTQARGYEHCAVAENIAYGELRRPPADAGEARAEAHGFVERWAASPMHRSNLLDPRMVETGVAVAHDAARGRLYAVQVFGRPARLQLVFSVANAASGPVRYRVDERAFELLPRQTRVHRHCAEVRLVLPAAGGAERELDARQGERYVLGAEDGLPAPEAERQRR